VIVIRICAFKYCFTVLVPEASSSSAETSFAGPSDVERVRLGLLELHPYTRYRIKRDVMLKEEEDQQRQRPFWRAGGQRQDRAGPNGK
jgi:hypothetical protein